MEANQCKTNEAKSLVVAKEKVHIGDEASDSLRVRAEGSSSAKCHEALRKDTLV